MGLKVCLGCRCCGGSCAMSLWDALRARKRAVDADARALTEAIRNLRETLASRRARQEALTQADSRQPSSCISWRLTLKDVLGWRMVSTAAVTVATVLASLALSSTWGRPVRGLSSTSTAALNRENKQ